MSNESLQNEYRPLLRLNRARELARRLGCTDYAFKLLCQNGQINTKKISSSRLHYYRDSIIETLSTNNQPRP